MGDNGKVTLHVGDVLIRADYVLKVTDLYPHAIFKDGKLWDGGYSAVEVPAGAIVEQARTGHRVIEVS